MPSDRAEDPLGTTSRSRYLEVALLFQSVTSNIRGLRTLLLEEFLALLSPITGSFEETLV